MSTLLPASAVAQPSKPRLLDLCCHEGGASAGYVAAGWVVVGVDVDPVPLERYPFESWCADALTVSFAGFDAVHASPPCQRWSAGTPAQNRSRHPDLIGPIRERLVASGLPYVIENVPGAPLRGDVMLCGSMFALSSRWDSWLRRHRYFEVGGGWSAPLFAPASCWHRRGRTVSVTGHGTPSGNRQTLGRNVSVAEWRELMGMPWASRRGLAEAIPPAYTEWLGTQLLAAL